MTDITMFEKAARLKLRFDSPKGQLTVEDLFSKDMPLTSIASNANLDDIAQGLHKLLKNSGEVSFVRPANTTNVTTQLKFDIVKYIIDTRIVERDEKIAATERADKKQKILSIIADKEIDALATTSIEDLRKMAAAL